MSYVADAIGLRRGPSLRVAAIQPARRRVGMGQAPQGRAVGRATRALVQAYLAQAGGDAMQAAVLAARDRQNDPGNLALRNAEHALFNRYVRHRLGPVLGPAVVLTSTPAYSLAKAIGQPFGFFKGATPPSFQEVAAGLQPLVSPVPVVPAPVITGYLTVGVWPGSVSATAAQCNEYLATHGPGPGAGCQAVYSDGSLGPLMPYVPPAPTGSLGAGPTRLPPEAIWGALPVVPTRPGRTLRMGHWWHPRWGRIGPEGQVGDPGVSAETPVRPFFRPPGAGVPTRLWGPGRSGMLRIGESPFGPYGTLGDLGVTVPEAALQVTAIYQEVLRRDPTAEELQTAAQAIAADLVTPGQVRDALRRLPAIDWRTVLWGGGGLAALWFLTALLRR